MNRTTFRRWLKQTVGYQAPGERDFYGDITYPDPITVPARYEEKQEVAVDKTGTQIVSSAQVLMELEPELEGKIIVGEKDRQIKNRESLVDLRGNIVGWRAFL